MPAQAPEWRLGVQNAAQRMNESHGREGRPSRHRQKDKGEKSLRITIDQLMDRAMGRTREPEYGRLYAAFGSNLNIQQMSIRCPDAEVVGTSRLENHKLMFCGRTGGAVATVVPAKGSYVPLLLWSLTPEDEWALDRYEGVPTLYRKEMITVRHRGVPTDALIYIMNEGRPYGEPGQGYLNVICEGYQSVRFDLQILRKALADSVYLSRRKA